jgi:uncharacterized membrane protein
MQEVLTADPIFKNNIIVFGILALSLAAIFYTSSLKSWKKFYSIFPSLLLCYIVPAILNTANVISSETPEYEELYYVATR